MFRLVIVRRQPCKVETSYPPMSNGSANGVERGVRFVVVARKNLDRFRIPDIFPIHSWSLRTPLSNACADEERTSLCSQCRLRRSRSCSRSARSRKGPLLASCLGSRSRWKIVEMSGFCLNTNIPRQVVHDFI